MDLNSIPRLAIACIMLSSSWGNQITVRSIAELAEATAVDKQQIRMEPGVYRMADYLTEEVLKEIENKVDRSQSRPPVPMLMLRGNANRIDLTGVTIEIDTSLYRKIPQGGYTRCIIISGDGNHIKGLNIRNTGDNRGSGGNTVSVQGDDNSLEDVTLNIHGSFPWGYGDLLGKGGPNLVPLEKQSGIQVMGSRSLLRRCKVVSRAFGHCFYIQGGEGSRIENCHAEGSVRATSDMLADSSGPAFDQGFRSVYRNRDGRFLITPGYTKSLSEDGFRTYGNAGNVTLVNCTAINTRAGFEIGARDDAKSKTTVENCEARGCERAYLIGSHTNVRNCRGDITHGPLLYLRGGLDSDVDIKLVGDPPKSLVHVIATIAGKNHRIRLTQEASMKNLPSLPILVGFGMPTHAEMSSPCEPAAAEGLDFKSEIPHATVIKSEEVHNSMIKTAGRCIDDSETRKDPGPWDLPPNGIADGISPKAK